ncbi:MAG: GNAT family N-acetyltransferase [bacterium]
MENLTIRKAEERDSGGISLLSTKIWEDDYLGRQFKRWMNDGNFFVAEVEGKTVGCAKISILPSKTGWLEGLRVDPAYQKMGIGREFNRVMVGKIKELKSNGIIDTIEYSTYYKNKESLHMGFKAGFRIIEKFIALSLDKRGETKPIDRFNARKIWLNDYGEYIPAGWKFLHNNPEGVNYLFDHCDIYKNNEVEFYAFRDERAFCFFEKNLANIIDSIPFMRYLARLEVEILIPELWSDILPELYKAGFTYWDEPREPNVYVLRMQTD